MRWVARGFGAGAGAVLGALAVLAPLVTWLANERVREIGAVFGGRERP